MVCVGRTTGLSLPTPRLLVPKQATWERESALETIRRFLLIHHLSKRIIIRAVRGSTITCDSRIEPNVLALHEVENRLHFGVRIERRIGREPDDTAWFDMRRRYLYRLHRSFGAMDVLLFTN